MPEFTIGNYLATRLEQIGIKHYLWCPGTTTWCCSTSRAAPGPSIINLPAPGCWTLHLSWSGHTDQLKLHYVA